MNLFNKKIFKNSLILVLLIILFVFYNFIYLKSYLIPGVPDYTFFSVGFNRGRWSEFYKERFKISPYFAVLDMIFDYWTGQSNYLRSKGAYPPYKEIVHLSDLANFARSQGFEAQVLTAKNIKDLHKFINSKERTPIVVQQKPDLNYSGKLRPMRLVIGLNDRKRKVIVHDFIFGNNYEISYKDFAELWKETNNAYAVVRPKNYKEILKKMTKKSKYQPRIPAMEQKNLLLNVVYAEELVSSTSSKEIFSSKELEKAIREIEKEETAFQYFPPFWRVLEYGSLLYYYVNKGDLTKALSYAEKIEEFNKDLDKKFDGWRYLWPYGKEFPEAWVWLGHLYLRVGNKEKAKDMFERAKNLQDRLSVEYRRYLQLGIDKLAK